MRGAVPYKFKSEKSGSLYIKLGARSRSTDLLLQVWKIEYPLLCTRPLRKSGYRRGSFKEWVSRVWMEVDVTVDETVESALGAREFRS